VWQLEVLEIKYCAYAALYAPSFPPFVCGSRIFAHHLPCSSDCALVVGKPLWAKSSDVLAHLQPFGWLKHTHTHERLHQCYLCKNNFQMFRIFAKVLGRIFITSVGQPKATKARYPPFFPSLALFLYESRI